MRILVACILLTTSLSGCSAIDEFINGLNRPDIPVQRTALADDITVTDPRFLVIVAQAEPLVVEIVAKSKTGEVLTESGVSDIDHPVEMILPDGIWDITYTVDGYEWESFDDVWVDSTPPEITGLQRVGDAQNGAYTIEGIVAEGERVEIYKIPKNSGQRQLVGDSLPFSITGLTDGLHIYTVVAVDPAGNRNPVNVQIRAGDAKALPEGQWDFGIVARYTMEAALWDLSDMDAYLTPAQAASQVPGYLGEGYGVTPGDSIVQSVVDEVITNEDTTAEIAWALFEWMYDNLEYDDARLESTTLMLPRQVISDTEDPDAEARGSQDAGNDGIADNGSGNGVKGGVCRDLAGTYVSLLRAAGVPARLVSGYLAGQVDGFHAWVEVYVGDVPGNPGPWMPVDVSPINGLWDDDVTKDGMADGLGVALQAFGIRLPEYLPLGPVDPPADDGWSTALSTQYTYPDGGREPDIEFQKDVRVVGGEQRGKLCFDENTFSRSIITSGNCSSAYFDNFVVFTEREIDYGIDVQYAPSGTEVTAQLAFPQDTLHQVYGEEPDVIGDKVEATWSP